MLHSKKSFNIKDILYNLYLSYIPNNRDNLKQIVIKVFFIISLVTLIISAGYITTYFLSANKQESIIEESKNIWHSSKIEAETTNKNPDIIDPTETLLKENKDFKGWITINNTKVDNPIYQTGDNSYYLTHNQKRQKSAYGALFFDFNNIITKDKTDKNLVIFGHEMKNGSMFGQLKKYKSLSFYKENPYIEFSTLYKTSTYKIFAVFLLNAKKSDDNGYIYNIYRNNFNGSEDFENWVNEAYQRSIINTGVDTDINDNIITLVTCSNDFKDARLVIMARETRGVNESSLNTNNAHTNPNTRYPKRWYDERKLEYPFK